MKSFTGIVQKGSKRATELGYPTINIAASDKDVSGVYAAQVFLPDGMYYTAAAFADSSRGILEAYIVDFVGDLYGEVATIELHEKIRESKKFDSGDELKAAIADDVAKVRQYFTTR